MAFSCSTGVKYGVPNSKTHEKKVVRGVGSQVSDTCPISAAGCQVNI